MVTGGSEKFEFIVSPPNADFNHDISSPDCQVKLKRITNAPVLNYRISRIMTLNPLQTGGL